jgi:hypothetical protein
VNSRKTAKLVRARDLLRRALEIMEGSGAAPSEINANVRRALAEMDAALGD